MGLSRVNVYSFIHSFKLTLARGRIPTGPLRILNSLQTVMICPLQVITLAPPVDPSKQCPQDLVILLFDTEPSF
jgi:hypothetical protein